MVYIVSTGKCIEDGLYYRDEGHFVVCIHKQAFLQPCAPGSRNGKAKNFRFGDYYTYADFCEVNLVDYGYAAKHSRYIDLGAKPHPNSYDNTNKQYYEQRQGYGHQRPQGYGRQPTVQKPVGYEQPQPQPKPIETKEPEPVKTVAEEDVKEPEASNQGYGYQNQDYRRRQTGYGANAANEQPK